MEKINSNSSRIELDSEKNNSISRFIRMSDKEMMNMINYNS